MQQELAVSFSDLHLLTFTIIGEGVFDDCCVILIDDIGLVVTGGEDDVATHCDPCIDKRRCEDIFVIDNCGVDTTERCIRCDLACVVVLFSRDHIRSLLIGEVTRDFPFSLGVGRSDKLGHGDLLIFLASDFQGRPSWGGGGHHRCWGSLCGGRYNGCIGRTIVFCHSHRSRTGFFLFFLFLGILLRRPHCWQSCTDSSLVHEYLMLQLCDPHTKRGDLVAYLVIVFSKCGRGISSGLLDVGSDPEVQLLHCSHGVNLKVRPQGSVLRLQGRR